MQAQSIGVNVGGNAGAGVQAGPVTVGAQASPQVGASAAGNASEQADTSVSGNVQATANSAVTSDADASADNAATPTAKEKARRDRKSGKDVEPEEQN